MNQQAAPDVSVVIPCLNEANSIAICVDKALAAYILEGHQEIIATQRSGGANTAEQ